MEPDATDVPKTPRSAPVGPSDGTLVRRVMAGDRKAFDELVTRYQRQAVAVSFRLLGSTNDALEVTQDSFLKAFTSLATLQKPEAFGGWLMRIVSNLSLNVAAARREVSEEVGAPRLEVISSLYDLDVHEIPANSREGEHLHFDLRVLFRCLDDEVRASDEVADARYFPLTELAEARGGAAGSDSSVARVARRLLIRAR